jgi:hypothetical protein
MIKRSFWIALLAASLGTSWGFSLLGPLPPDPGGEPWQIFAIGYAEGGSSYFGSVPGAPFWFQDIGGPHNIGEGYRRNAPILYYSYDPSFTTGDYFGVQGQQAIDNAFAIMNGITNVDHYTHALTEFPFTGQHINYTAQAMYLTDLKSETLHFLVEQLGLADPARYTWTLHDRYQSPVPCPVGTYYTVVQRNFDGTTEPSLQNLVYSAYVNDELLSYYISEVCTGSSLLAATVPYLTDPEGLEGDPVAANTFVGDWNANEFESSTLHLPTAYGLQIGGYYSGLTRDDVAGLRYLLSTNNADVEPIPATSLLYQVSTNFTFKQLFPNLSGTNVSGTNGLGFYYFDGNFGYGDYGALVAASLTNSPAALEALYPGLVIASSSNYFVLATNWIYTQYFTNLGGYGQPYPPPLTLVTASNPVPFLLDKYVTKFANVFPDPFHPQHPTTTYKLQTITVTPQVGAAYGSPLVTNITTVTKTLAIPSGDFFLLPMFQTNVCPLDILSTGLTNVISVTNSLTATVTNLVTATNTSTYTSTLSEIFSFTNYTFETYPTTCGEISNAVSKFRGVGGIHFVRDDTYDYLIGQYIYPITNYYTMDAYNFTNNTWELRHLVRIVTRPDILLGSQDLATGPAAVPLEVTLMRNITYNSSEIVPGLHGPGLIDSPTEIIYNRVGTLFANGPFTDANSFLNPTEVNETTQMPGLQWASYDNTTNAPIIYPNTTSLENLENQVTIQLITSPPGPLSAVNGLNYSVQFSAVGGPFTPQFTWSASGLPSGLFLSSNGVLSGAPTASGTYDFVLQLTDIEGRTVQWTLSITIN